MVAFQSLAAFGGSSIDLMNVLFPATLYLRMPLPSRRGGLLKHCFAMQMDKASARCESADFHMEDFPGNFTPAQI